MTLEQNKRILLVDDNPAIHEDFEKILEVKANESEELSDARSAFFDDDDSDEPAGSTEGFVLDFAVQGKDGYEKVKAAREEERPFAMAFIDVRMPPGWDGIETIEKMWQVDPDLQVVICTAYADYSREEMLAKLGNSDRLLILKKPFDPVEVTQLASALTEKWNLAQREKSRIAELEEARKKAEQATKAKSAFLANMSHEIRTPMIAILGYGDMIDDPDLTREEIREHVDTIRRSGQHLLSVIDNILDLSRIEAGRMFVDSIECSPIEIMEEVQRLLSESAAQKSIELFIETSTPVPERVQCDPVRMRQILLNLVGNAIKFTEVGSVRLICGAEHREGEEPGWELSFEVLDTGIGMNEDQLVSLFRPFSQVDSSMTRRYGGNGLGLVLSRRLAQMMGGDIMVTSKPGDGSSFEVHVLADAVDGVELISEPRAALPESAVRGGNLSADSLKNLKGRVLLAEDVLSTQKLYSIYLKRAGFEVELAENGREAIDHIQTAHAAGKDFDVVLMDMQMPELDGYEATRQLRSSGYKGPIVALTAHAMKGDRERCLEAGCDEYAAKPIQRHELVGLCRDVIAKATLSG